MHKRPLQYALEKREGQSQKSVRILDFLLFRSYQDRRCPCSCPQFVYAERNKGREQSVTQAVFVQTLTVRLSVSSATLMSRVCPAVPGKAFPVPISLATHPAFSRSTKIHLPPPHGSSSPWTLCKVQAGHFAILRLPLPVFVPLTRDWQKVCVAPVFRPPQEIGLSLSFGFACRPPNAFAGIRTDIPTSYQTVTQTQYS